MKIRVFTFALVPLFLLAAGADAQNKEKRPAKGRHEAPAPPPVVEAPPPAPPAAPSLADTLTGDAKADYSSGILLYGDGDNAGALVKFTGAYEKSKDPRLLWNMAACEKNLRHYAKALRLVRSYVKEGDKLATDQDKADANELIKVMEPFTSKLNLMVSEPGADVFIDDDSIGPSPVEPTIVDIGTRKVRVHKAEFEDFSRDVPIGGAAEVALDVKLVKIVHEGRLNVRAAASDSIVIDGQAVALGSWSGVLPSGGHTLRVTAPKKIAYQSEVLIQDNQTRDVPVTLQDEPSKGLPAWAWITGGIVVAGGLATGGYFLFKPSNAYDGPVGNLGSGMVQAGAPIRFR